ncbi:NAP-domain-containing protein [Neoconidiobolus thromboides FSU 785]|nr:NAP-domain-containing protein [Neoconidiobolus thromboides FSU 785]
MDISGRKNMVAPTPNNTPLNAAPISSSMAPNLPTMEEDEVLNLEQGGAGFPNAALVEMIQGRLGSLMGRKSGYVNSLPEEVQTRINGLKGLQLKQAELEAQFNKKVFDLEKEFLKLYQPLFEERTKVISGDKEPNSEDIEAGKKIREEEEQEEGEPLDSTPKSNEVMDGIPEFWLTALKNHPGVADIINDDDEKVLKKLVNIEYRFLESDEAFAIDFHFDENEYFKNRTLTKTYYYTPSTDFGEYILDRSEGTEIEWNNGKNLTMEIQQKKQINKITHETRIIQKEIPKDSFFTFFSQIPQPNPEHEDFEEQENAFQQAMEADYALGEEFKVKIIPHAIDWFTGKALAYDYSNDVQYYDEDDEDEDDEDDEDDLKFD